MNIDSKSLESLDFSLILKRLKSLCFAEESAAELARQPFLDDPAAISLMHDRVEDLSRLYAAEGEPSFYLPAAGDLFDILRPENAVASASDLHRWARFFDNYSQLRSWLTRDFDLFEGREPSFRPLISDALLPDCGEVLRTFDSEGNMLESHPDILKMQKERSGLNREMSQFSGSFLSKEQELWQENRPVIRDGRLLLPLKSNFRGRVKGVIHEVSASGNTLFIEPVEMMELNNRMVELDNRRRQIQLKWMKTFSARFRDSLEELREIHKSLIRLDQVSARARYVRIYDCHRPVFGESFQLSAAVHPALGSAAVPVNICFEPGSRLVIISGPNAGGKTVTLKTAALAVMMNQFGLFLHAGEGASLPLFSGIVSAIGDNQSIEEGSSTFSGYMKRVSEILEQADRDTLVLLDELGSGTDPSEGSALGVAILDRLQECGARTLVTSHHKDIRNYAQTAENAVNASVEFDEKLHRPTYQIRLGLPGESRAMDMAAASGIPADIVESARKLLEAGRGESMRLMETLTKKEHELAQREEELLASEEQVREKRRKADLRELQLKQKELEIKKERGQDNNRFIRQTRKELEGLVAQLAEMQKKAGSHPGGKQGGQVAEASSKVRKFMDGMEKQAGESRKLVESIEEDVIGGRGYEFKPGMKVLVGQFKRKGEIVRKDKKNSWLIMTDSLKISVKESDLVPDPSEQGEPSRKAAPEVTVIRESSGMKAQLVMDIRGLTLAESLERLHKQMELAILNNLSQFSIIHGLGTGVLQQGIRNELKEISSVRDFHYARPENGGHGRTEVILDQ